jgi:hypothetical protein
MEEFSLEVESPRIREELLNTIHRCGAFGNFKSAIRRHASKTTGTRFAPRRSGRIAIDWCEENGIAWEKRGVGRAKYTGVVYYYA